MSRDGSGNMNLAPGNPVVPGTTITAAHFNSTMNDIAAALTGSLPRDGQAGMTGPFRLADGTASIPAFAFNSEASTGLYRPGTGVLGFSAGAGERMRLLSNGNLLIGTTSDTGEKLQVTGTTKVTGNTSVGGTLSVTGASTLASLGVAGEATLSGTLGVSGATTMSSTLGVAGATTLASLGVTGATTLSSTLGVTGATTLSSTLGVAGATTLASLGVTGATALSSTLGVSGATTLASLGVTGTSTLASLNVTGATSLTSLALAGAVTGVTNLTTTGSTILGDAVGDTLNVAGGSLQVSAAGYVGIGAAPTEGVGAVRLQVGSVAAVTGGLLVSSSTSALSLYASTESAAYFVCKTGTPLIIGEGPNNLSTDLLRLFRANHSWRTARLGMG